MWTGGTLAQKSTAATTTARATPIYTLDETLTRAGTKPQAGRNRKRCAGGGNQQYCEEFSQESCRGTAAGQVPEYWTNVQNRLYHADAVSRRQQERRTRMHPQATQIEREALRRHGWSSSTLAHEFGFSRRTFKRTVFSVLASRSSRAAHAPIAASSRCTC